MEFRVLGPLELIDGGRARMLAGAKERAVLACLLLEPGRPVPADDLLEAAWPGVPRAAAARSLAVRLANLRAFLEPERRRGAPSTVVLHDGGHYRLEVDPGEVDAQRFGALLRRAATEPPAVALASYEAALGLWRGAPFPELGDAPLARAEIHRLQEWRAQAAEGRVRALLDQGRHEAALPDLRRLVGDEPWREELVRMLAIALYRSGRQVDALDAVRALAGELRELGLDASPETRLLERQILDHDPTLAAPAIAPRSERRPVEVDAGRLPTRASSFFGRDADLARAAELMANAPLMTITGVGGIGKTRLALELAARSPMPRWWCELGPVDHPDDVPGAVGDAFGLEPAAGGCDVRRIAERLTAEPALLVLDNCEHVLDGAADLSERLLAFCPGVRIVATSRAPLGVEGERVLRLGGLALDAPGLHGGPSAAAALFLDRARAVGGLVDAAGPEVEEVCRRLDGLPLAIELAAGRTRSMTPAEIVAALDERFGVLVVPGRRTVARHATLRAAIDWSYELLDEKQRRVFERLSVFHRGWTLAAAQDVAAGAGVEREDVHAILDQLVAHSMLCAEAVRDRTRYRLPESLRDYAGRRLRARGEEARARECHAAHYAARVTGAVVGYGSRRSPHLPHAGEFDDVRAAVRWCLETGAPAERAFVLVGALWMTAIDRHAEEIALLAEEALVQRPERDRARLHALGTAATARMSLGDTERARAHADAAVAFEDVAGAPALVARRVLCGIAFQAGDIPGALRLTRDLADRARAAGDEPLACETEGFTAQLHDAAGDSSLAMALALEMRARADLLRAPFLTSWSRYVSGVVSLRSSPTDARDWFTQSLASARATSRHHMIRFNLRALGVVALLERDHGEAAQRLRAALDYNERRSNPATQWATLLAIAPLLAAEGRDAAAVALLSAADRAPSAPLLGSLAIIARLASDTRGEAARRLAPGAHSAAVARGRGLDVGAAVALARAELSAVLGDVGEPAVTRP